MEYYDDVSLSTQSKELESILRQSFPHTTKFDIIGFSLGARIALSTIALFPTLIRKAHLTGVGLMRSSYAKVLISTWKDILQSGLAKDDGHSLSSSSSSSLSTFAWSIIMATYSKDVIANAGPDKIKSWVDHICQNNNPIGLLKLLEQTHGDILYDEEETDTTKTQNKMYRIANQIKKNNNEGKEDNSNIQTRIRLHVGEMDEIATVTHAKELHELLRRNDEDDVITVYKGCTHAVMNENGVKWRRDALDYLNCY